MPTSCDGFCKPPISYCIYLTICKSRFFSSKPNDAVDAICEDRYKTNRDIYANDNDELMRHQEVEIVDMAPTPATQGGPVPVFQFLMVR